MNSQNSIFISHEILTDTEYLYEIDNITRLTDTIYELHCVNEVKPISFSPGQYVKIACGDEKFRNFSIASSDVNPRQLKFDLRIRQHNQVFLDFLFHLKHTQHPLRIKGPYGLRAETFHAAHELLFIADGMGIVPLISILQSMLARQIDKKVDVIWFLNENSDHYLQSLFETCRIQLSQFHATFLTDHSFEPILLNNTNTQNALLFVSGGEPLLKNVLQLIEQKKLIVKEMYSDLMRS